MVPEYLRNTLFYMACLVALVIFVVLIYALLTFKKRNYAKDGEEPNIKVELLWTIVPFVMICLMLLPAIKAFYQKPKLEKPKISITQRAGQ